MTKDEFRQFLRDPDICREVFEIIKKGGKPAVPAQQFTKPTPQIRPIPQAPPTPQIRPIPQVPPTPPPRVQPLPKVQATPPPPKVPPQPTQPTQAAPKVSSVSDKLKLLRGQLDKVREEEQRAVSVEKEQRPAEKYTVVLKRRCPICDKETRVVKPRSRINIEKRDIDCCVHYRDFNPYLYIVFVCEQCGFAAEEKKFTGIFPTKTKETMREFLDSNNLKLPFVEERNVEDALSIFETAILFSELTDKSKGRQAILYLKAAWMCRCEGLQERERDCLEKAVANFASALEDERWPIDGISDDMATYLCAAIYFLLRDFDKSIVWLGRIMNNANLRVAVPKLFEQARDMWLEIKRLTKT